MSPTAREEENRSLSLRSGRDRDGPGPRRLTRARQRLVLRYLRLAKAWARPFKRGWSSSRDEFDGAAHLALVEAAARYDPMRGVSFGAFAQARIRGALIDTAEHLRRVYRAPEGSDQALVRYGFRDADSETLFSTRDDPVGARFEAEEFAERWIDRLPRPHADAFREIYVKGSSQQQAAAVLGCSKSRLSVLHKEAIDLIRTSCAIRLEVLDRKARGGADGTGPDEFERTNRPEDAGIETN